jgi:hypothetical protein
VEILITSKTPNSGPHVTGNEVYKYKKMHYALSIYKVRIIRSINAGLYAVVPTVDSHR